MCHARIAIVPWIGPRRLDAEQRTQVVEERERRRLVAASPGPHIEEPTDPRFIGILRRCGGRHERYTYHEPRPPVDNTPCLALADRTTLAGVLADGLPEVTTREQGAVDRTVDASHLWDPNDLEAQRWGVIAPQGPEGDRLLALIQPLLAHRQDQQGDRVRVYRVPPRMTQDEAMRWKKQEFDAGNDLNIEVPRYQLILGDLDQVPLALQQVQACDGDGGRLAFTAEGDYAA